MKPILSVDWLQLHVKMPCRDFEKFNSTYFIEKQDYQTRHFKSVYIIKTHKDGEQIATMQGEPHSHILSFDSGLIKLDNKYLYQKELSAFVKDLLKKLGLEFRSISRLDIAMDFLKFKNGLNPENFIKKFVSGEFIKDGKTKGKVTFLNSNIKKGLIFETLKFGSETSDITYYLYNKTKELSDVKMKGWITDNWKANGWDGKETVWRLEFSLKPNTKGMIDAETGEQLMSFKDINTIENLERIYKYHFERFFLFRKNEHKIRKDRCAKIDLLDLKINFSGVMIELSDKIEALRSDKVFAKKLMKVNQEMRGHDFDFAIYTKDILQYFISTHGIDEWADRKIPGWCDSDMFENNIINKAYNLKRYQATIV